MTEEIAVQVTAADAHTVVAVSGEIDINTVPAVRDAIDAAVANRARRLIVDLEGVPFMDSGGLNLLIGVVNRLGPGSLAVVASQTHIRRLFTLTGVDAVIPVFDSVAAAMEATTKEAGSG